jgi:hypothetical protein
MQVFLQISEQEVTTRGQVWDREFSKPQPLTAAVVFVMCAGAEQQQRHPNDCYLM